MQHSDGGGFVVQCTFGGESVVSDEANDSDQSRAEPRRVASKIDMLRHYRPLLLFFFFLSFSIRPSVASQLPAHLSNRRSRGPSSQTVASWTADTVSRGEQLGYAACLLFLSLCTNTKSLKTFFFLSKQRVMRNKPSVFFFFCFFFKTVC